MTRRSLFTSAAAVAAGALGSRLARADNRFNWNVSALDQSILNSTTHVLHRLLVANFKNSVHAGRLHQVAASVDTLFQHFEQIGLNAACQAVLESYGMSMIEPTPSRELTTSVGGMLKPHGLTCTPPYLNPETYLGLRRYQGPMVQFIQANGLKATAAIGTAALRNVAAGMQARSLPGTDRGPLFRTAQSTAPLTYPFAGSASSPAQAWTLFGNGLGLVGGIWAAVGTGVEVFTAFTCPVCLVAGAVISAVGAAASYYGSTLPASSASSGTVVGGGDLSYDASDDDYDD